MYKKKALVREEDVVLVSTAREGLPTLVNRVSHGGRPVKIGPRGKPAAVLMGIDEYEALQRRAAAARPTTWRDLGIEMVGAPVELDQAMTQLSRDNTAALDRRIDRYTMDAADFERKYGEPPGFLPPHKPRARRRRSRK
jgi:prevent-host-death family protein